MIELPEAKVLSSQLNKSVRGKAIARVSVNKNPHKLVWFWGDPEEYPTILTGRSILEARPLGGLVEILFQDYHLALSDGVRILFHETPETLPEKHQLLLSLADGTALSFSVQMYGGISCFRDGENTNPYYLAALEKPSPYSDRFTGDYFLGLINEKSSKLSLKAFLATEQRIPGLGNGVLQDILWRSRLNPKRKVASLEASDFHNLYTVLLDTLTEMADKRGRDTERDLFGSFGGFNCIMKASNSGKPCPVCGNRIEKSAYMGGSVYTCPGCQKG